MNVTDGYIVVDERTRLMQTELVYSTRRLGEDAIDEMRSCPKPGQKGSDLARLIVIRRNTQ